MVAGEEVGLLKKLWAASSSVAVSTQSSSMEHVAAALLRITRKLGESM